MKTSENWADIFTKPLERAPFQKCRRVLMNVVDSLVGRVSFAVGFLQEWVAG